MNSQRYGEDLSDEELDARADQLTVARSAGEPKTADLGEEVPSATSEFYNLILADIRGDWHV